MMWERLRPNQMAALVGNEDSRLEILRWLKSWKVGTKPLFLLGPPGVGKTTSVHAVAKHFGYSLVEFNASDIRTEEKLKSTIGPILQNLTLFGEKDKLIVFMDEVDGISSRADHSGLAYITDFLRNATVPVALAANSEDDPKLKKIIQKSLVVRFRPVPEELILVYLRSVVKRLQLQIPEKTLVQAARNSRGDVRSALNLLQTVSRGEIGGSLADHEFLSEQSAIEHVFKSSTLEDAATRLRDFDARPYDKILPIFNAIVAAKGITETERRDALRLLAEADMLVARISGAQLWRLLRYLDRYLAQAIESKKLRWVESSIPWNVIVSIWNDGRVVKELEDRVAPSYHVGKGTFSALYLPYMSFYFKQRQTDLFRFLARYEISDSEKRVLLKIASK